MGVPERRQREKIERRESILAAAERVFVRKGISSATMEDIAREAELSKGALYLYFQSKDELFLAIALRAADEFGARYAAALSRKSDKSGFEALSEGLHEYVRYAQEQPDRFRAAMSWMSVEYPVDGNAPLFKEYSEAIDRIRGMAQETVVRGQADGSVRKDIAAARMSVQLWGATLGVIMLDENQQEIERRMPGARVGSLAAEFASMVLDGVRTSAAPSETTLSR
jgi:AcrR family transcriptional regulator